MSATEMAVPRDAHIIPSFTGPCSLRWASRPSSYNLFSSDHTYQFPVFTNILNGCYLDISEDLSPNTTVRDVKMCQENRVRLGSCRRGALKYRPEHTCSRPERQQLTP